MKLLKQENPSLREMVWLVLPTRTSQWRLGNGYAWGELHVPPQTVLFLPVWGSHESVSAADHRPVLGDVGLRPRGHPAEGRPWQRPALPFLPSYDAVCTPPPQRLRLCSEGKVSGPALMSQPRRSMDAASPQCGLSLLSH